MKFFNARLVVCVVTVGALAWVGFGASIGLLVTVTAALPLAVAALGQDLILNRAGQASFGGAALAAVGAYTVVELQEHASWIPFPLPLIVAGAVGGMAGVVVGLPGVRVRGLYLLLSTLALQVVITFVGQEIQGGSNLAGLFVSGPKLGGATLTSPRELFILNAVILGIVCLVLLALYSSGAGRAWQAIRENEIATRVMGLPTVQWKLYGFVVSSVITAIGGALYAYVIGNVTSDTFSLTLAISVVVMVYVGGRGTLIGPILGAVLVSIGPYEITNLEGSSLLPSNAANWLLLNGSNLANAVYASLLLVVFVFYRNGLVDAVRRLGRVLPSRRGSLGAVGGGMSDQSAVKDIAVSQRGSRGE